MSHSLLQRQLKNLGLVPDSLPTDLGSWQEFLSRVDKVYKSGDQERYLLERSLQISSKEMQDRWQSLKLLEEQWRSLGECAPDFIAMTDTAGVITFANRARSTIEKGDLVGRRLVSLYPQENVPQILDLLRQALDTSEQRSMEIAVRSENPEVWLSVRLKPIIRDKRLLGLIVVETDITDQRKVALEIAARKRAEEAAETKARFLATMSHEIRTPLNGILGIASLLAENMTGEDNIRHLNILQNCGQTLLALVNDILDFSKIEAGKFALEHISFDLPSSVKDIVDLLKNKALEKGLLLQYEIENSIPIWIFGDPTRVRQILLNLVGNAIKFTDRGQVLITVTSKQLKAQTHEIRIGVRDTGLGIAPENQKELFQPFSQVDAATTRKFGGTGLGLSICKGLSEAMGGKIGLTSEIGKGSEFFFTMVATEAPPRNTRQKCTVFEHPSEDKRSKSFKILVAEDNRVNQMVIIGFLKNFGYSADIAENGIETIHLLEKQKYDLILMDCHMPEMDGFEATKEIIRRWQKNRPIIVAATASALQEDRERCLACGMDDILLKPITPDSLSKILTKYSNPSSSKVHTDHLQQPS